MSTMGDLIMMKLFISMAPKATITKDKKNVFFIETCEIDVCRIIFTISIKIYLQETLKSIVSTRYI